MLHVEKSCSILFKATLPVCYSPGTDMLCWCDGFMLKFITYHVTLSGPLHVHKTHILCALWIFTEGFKTVFHAIKYIYIYMCVYI
jgi:hypothetical protein